MIWVKSVKGAEELAKLLNNLADDERYDSDDWEVLVEDTTNDEVFYTVLFRSETDDPGEISAEIP